jgi:hypothetical protein
VRVSRQRCRARALSLNYFSRTSEWSDFQLIVKSPTAGKLNWQDDAVSEVFNITNGNPYFAKIVCASVFRQAVTEREAPSAVEP